MGKKIQLLLAGLILLANLLVPQAKSEQTPGSNNFTLASLTPSWTTGIISDGIGPANILVVDLNKNGKTDIASCSNGHAYILNHIGGNHYNTTWYSEYVGCRKIVSGDRDANGYRELYIATDGGRVVIFDSRNYKLVGDFALPMEFIANDLEIADVDSDGKQEIVLVNDKFALVYDAVSYKLEWTAAGLGGTQVAIGNIDSDAVLEIVVNGSIGHILNAQTKVQEWGYSGGFGTSMDIGDVDGDKRAEIAFSKDWDNLIVLDGDTKTIKWQKNDLGYLDSLSVADADGDGKCDIVIGTGQGGSVTGIRGTDGTGLWSIANPEYGVSGIGVGDANNDGTNEILFGAGLSHSGKDVLIAGSWKSQSVQWVSEDLDGPFHVAAGDLDLDGRGEVVMASYGSDSGYWGGILKVYDGTTHRMEWSTAIDVNSLNINQVAIGQLDSDPALEILICGYLWSDARLQVYDGITKNIEWTSSSLIGSPSGIKVMNIDGDSVDEIVIATGDSHVQVMNGASSVIEWDSGIVDGQIQDIELGYLNDDSILDLAILTNTHVYIYRVDTWEQGLSRPFLNGKKLAIVSGTGHSGGEIVFATSSSNTYGDPGPYLLEAWNGSTYNIAWNRSLEDVQVHDLDAADPDSDGTQELLVMGRTGGSDSSRSFFGIASKSYPFFWESQSKRSWGPINGSAVSDVDNDGQNELLFSSTNLIQINNITATNKTVGTTYLPLVGWARTGLYGKVTENGAPAARVPLFLRFYNGNEWSTARTTETADDGSYIFNGAPSLLPGQAYYVLFLNEYENWNRLWTWHTPSLLAFESGGGKHMGDFDIANISLISPNQEEKVNVPTTFQWIPRASTPSDSYEVNLFNPYNDDEYFYTKPPLGYVGQFELNALPAPLKINSLYVWNLWVYGPDGGFGVSFETRAIYFANTNRSSSLSSPLLAETNPPKDLNRMDIQERP